MIRTPRRSCHPGRLARSHLFALLAASALGCGDPGFYTPPPTSAPTDDSQPDSPRPAVRTDERLSHVTGVELVRSGDPRVFEIHLRFANGCCHSPRVYEVSQSASRVVLQVRHVVSDGPCTQAIIETSVIYRQPAPISGSRLEVNGRTYGPF